MPPVKHILTVDKAPRESGIYAIVCEANGKRYIGSSENIRRRLIDHIRTLTNGGHRSKLMQNAWNKYGALAFHFEVLELVPKKKLLKTEQRWLDLYKSAQREYGYNIRTVAENNLGMRHSLKARKRMSKSQKGKKRTPEQCARISKALRGLIRTAEACAAISAAKSSPKAIRALQKRNKAMWTKAHREYMRELVTGTGHNAATRKKISESLKGKTYESMGRVVSKETRSKISALHIGKIVSEATREKLRVANLGKKLSEKTCKKLRIILAKNRQRRHDRFIKESKILRAKALKLSEQGVKQKDIAKKLGLVYQSHVSRLIRVEKELRGIA